LPPQDPALQNQGQKQLLPPLGTGFDKCWENGSDRVAKAIALGVQVHCPVFVAMVASEARFPSQATEFRNSWLTKFIAVLALINLVLVFFDLSYIPWRDFYLQTVPGLVQIYDPVKGIESHPETEAYLRQVEALEAHLIVTGIASPETAANLKTLQGLSLHLIEDNPFDVANKSGTLAKIKTEMRTQVGAIAAHEAFTTFWSPEYLRQTGWPSALEFFNQELRPLLQTNYYRDIGRFGRFIDRFWFIDLPFGIIFLLDSLIRSYRIGRRNPQLNWLEALLRRWYDLPLLLPGWRWLRVIPVSIRLYQAHLLNLNPVRAQLNHDFAVSFAQELTEMVGIQMIDQAQAAIQQGELARWLFHPETRRPYVQVNNQNEAEVIAGRLVTLGIYEVLPQIQPDIQALLHHTIQQAFQESTLTQQFQRLPGLGHFPAQAAERLATNLSDAAYRGLVKALEDPTGLALTDRLMHNFRQILATELQKKHNLQELESLLVDMLEEIKINYVKGLTEAGVEKVVAEAQQLHQIVQR
jgi:hypothetical protein